MPSRALRLVLLGFIAPRQFTRLDSAGVLLTNAFSKCIKSAVFGDADNLWEVLWYPNSGVQGGEFASLYLSCVVRSYFSARR
jgi:hypothetical protein